MSDESFGYFFEEHIKASLRQGGDPDHMVSLAKIHSKEDATLRDYAFREWLYDEEFRCERCRGTFRVKDADEWDDVLCERCRVKK